MASQSDDSFERARSPPTKLRPPGPSDPRPLASQAARPSHATHNSRGRSSPSPHRAPSPRAAGHLVIPVANAPQPEKGGSRKEKGTSRVLAELADLRTQLEAHARTSAARQQELTASQQEIGALKAELRRRDATVEPSKLHSEVNRLTQENAMVLEYLDKSMEEIKRHKEAHQKLLQLQADQQRHAHDLQELAAQREQQLQQAEQHSMELAAQLAEARRQVQEGEAQLEECEGQRQATEATLARVRREHADLQAIQDELLDSLQAAQTELQAQQLQQPPRLPVGAPPPHDLARLIQRNTEALQQQQAVLAEFLRQTRLQEFRASNWLSNAELTIGSLCDEADTTRLAPSAVTHPVPHRAETGTPKATADSATHCEGPVLHHVGTQTTAASGNHPSASEEVARLQSVLEAAQQQHATAVAVYERELQHLRVQQEMRLVERVDQQCYESLQRSYELSEARGRLLNASLSFYASEEDPLLRAGPPQAAPLRVT
eukprot:GGOE01024510.1.p1 GENE.GGOE01024510.1~~GGOE01024510.1.p1  ORF type:complete len:490 (-),score=154.22 GGOE01024510.1:140-1609(-)